MVSMKSRITGRRVAVAALALMLSATVWAQGGDKYKARLAPPLGIQTRPASAAVAGIGSATATLSGRKLTAVFQRVENTCPAAVCPEGHFSTIPQAQSRATAPPRAINSPFGPLPRKARPEIALGMYGEHGGDPDSVKFCHRIGLKYVSCPPLRVPVARLAAAQAALEE